jgi:spermidine synthase
MTDRNRLLHPLFFLSGASGLVYEVVWVRAFGNLFGNTVYSAALVTAIFMCGLGVGSLIAGKIADRRFESDRLWPLHAYAFAELGIAGFGLFAALLLPRLDGLSALGSSYVEGEHGWIRLSLMSELFRYAIAIVLLTPSTLLMGGTLTILSRFVVGGTIEHAGAKIAALYAANTLGAALGCFAVDFAFVPSLGLFSTQLLAIAINLLVGLMALTLARRVALLPREPEPEPQPKIVRSGTHPSGLPIRSAISFASISLLLSGFASMGMQILWFRQLSSLLRSQRNVFSLLLTTILIGLGIGTLIGGRIAKRAKDPVTAWSLAQLSFGVTALLALATLVPLDLITADLDLRYRIPAEDGWAWAGFEYALISAPILQAVLIPSIFAGAAYPFANAYVQQLVAPVGARAGTLYLANTIGAVIGALGTGFFFLPLIGLKHSAAILGSAAILAAVPVSAGASRRWGLGVALLFSGGLAVAAFSTLIPSAHFVLQTLPGRADGEKILGTKEGVNETILVTERPGYMMRLVTNGHSMSGTSLAGQRYMRLMAHIPLLTHPNPKAALVICFGVGNTVSAVLEHPVERADVVELSESVLEMAHYFTSVHKDALGDPRVRVIVNDGRQHLRMTPKASYDFITLEPPPLSNAGVASLYSVEFYELAKSRLRPGGSLTQWLPIYQMTEHGARSIVRAFVEAFPNAVLLSGYRRELILWGQNSDRITVDPIALRARMEALGVERSLTPIFAGTLDDLLATFAGGPIALERATRSTDPVTDNFPIMEHESALFAARVRIPPELFDVGEFGSFCPSCDGESLRAYLAIQARLYQSDDFLEPLGKFKGWDKERWRKFAVDDLPGAEEAIAKSEYLKALTRWPINKPR